MMRLTWCLALLLAGCVHCYTEGLPDRDMESRGGPPTAAEGRTPDVLAVLRGCFGDVYGTDYENQRALPEPAPFWNRNRLYKVVNYTWPHCPGCKAALSDDGDVILLSGMADGLRSEDPVGAFNRIARAEGRPITKAEARAYARFFMRCYVGSFEDARLQGSHEAATNRKLPPEPLAVEASKETFVVRGWYAASAWVVRVRLTIRASDGTVGLVTFGPRQERASTGRASR